jgi:hypothetical protein
MRKSMLDRSPNSELKEHGWLDLEHIAQVEITSEDPAHPIESALEPGQDSGWRAAQPGPQVIRFNFDQPQRIRRIHLLIREQEQARTQEFTLRWSPDKGGSYREIVRQQYNFSPSGTTSEAEEYQIDLAGVTILELEINPDVSGGRGRACLESLRVG